MEKIKVEFWWKRGGYLEEPSPGKERDSPDCQRRQVPCRNLIDSSAHSALKSRDCARAAVQVIIALLTIAILVTFPNNSLVLGITFCAVALWGFSKLFFNNEHRYFIFIMSLWILYKGIMEILSYYR